MGQHGPGYFPALPSSQLPMQPGGAPGSLENDLFQTEERVSALRAKLCRLEADMIHGSQTPAIGHIRLVVSHLFNGGHLGLRVHGCVVAEVVHPEAWGFGWFPGDIILKVNGYPVEAEPDFAREVAKAVDGYRTTGRPLVFDVFRQLQPGMMAQACRPSQVHQHPSQAKEVKEVTHPSDRLRCRQ